MYVIVSCQSYYLFSFIKFEMNLNGFQGVLFIFRLQDRDLSKQSKINFKMLYFLWFFVTSLFNLFAILY